MVVDMSYFTKVLKKVFILILTLVAIYLSFKLALFYMPFLIGFIISLLIEPIIKFINKRTKLTRKTSAIIVLVCIFSILIFLIIWGVVTLITESSNLLQSLNIYIEKIYVQIQRYINNVDFEKIKIPKQVISIIQNATSNFLEFLTKWISNFLTSILQNITSIPIIGIYIVITILSTYFMCADKMYMLDQLEHHFPKLWVKKFGIHLKKLVSTLGGYLKAEATLILISFIEVLIGLYIFKICGLNVPYPFLAALRNRICGCTSNTRVWNGNASLGYYIFCKWRFKAWNCDICFICNNTCGSSITRAKSCWEQYRNTPSIHINSNVYRF